ncbi:MAG: 30S ribosomal protein S8 [Deltaproteobacteria bacterium]|nr:MAG: 30S ribosomal protein S8 [Deltaproteobacteria bacterium]
MGMTDPVADMLTRIRNGQMAGHARVTIPRSNLKSAIVRILKSEGFIKDFVEVPGRVNGRITVELKYDEDSQGIIRGIDRVSKPGRRVYVGKDDIPRVRNGLGVAILTTPRGVITDHQAREAGVGGEILCKVW